MVVVVKDLIYSASGTLLMLCLTVITSILAFCSKAVYNRLTLHPYETLARKRFYTFLTAGFVHNSLIHLVFNLLFIYVVGYALEDRMVNRYGYTHADFILLYFCAITVCNLMAALLNRRNFLYRSAGASAVILAMMASYSVFRLSEKLAYFEVFDSLVFSYLFLLLVLAVYHRSFAGKKIFFDHDAHLSGMLSGALVTIFILLHTTKLFS